MTHVIIERQISSLSLSLPPDPLSHFLLHHKSETWGLWAFINSDVTWLSLDIYASWNKIKTVVTVDLKLHFLGEKKISWLVWRSLHLLWWCALWKGNGTIFFMEKRNYAACLAEIPCVALKPLSLPSAPWCPPLQEKTRRGFWLDIHYPALQIRRSLRDCCKSQHNTGASF